MMPLPLTSPIRAANPPLERLATDPTLSEEQKIGEVCRQFEAILLRQILQQGRKTIIDSEFTSDSTASSIYQDMMTDTLADAISRSGSFGVARALQAQLSRQFRESPASPAADSPAPSHP
ncbi:MAG TPA: rod-binding protein [Methylomirabilota bacterium]|nr:rod-binding protein [Methylomirabilota bacterium]